MNQQTTFNPYTTFKGDNAFLSNFHEVRLVFGDWVFWSSEHAYQAAKSEDPEDWLRIQKCASPGQAKRVGQKLFIRSDWERVKLDIMEEILRVKFSDTALKDRLIKTGDYELIEGNYWGDTYWGVCRGKGQNHLGKILMKIRSEIQNDPT